MPRPVLAIELELSAGVYTDVTADVVLSGGLRIRRGMPGTSPTDRVAATGTCEFALRNSALNSGQKQGYYSPGHANCRSGFARGIKVRVKMGAGETADTGMFLGRLASITPTPGQYRRSRTRCLAVDWMEDAATATIRGVAVQLNKRADELLTTLLAALPTASQPDSTSFGTGADTFPYVFDNLGGGGVQLMTLLQSIVLSELGYLWVTATGQLKFLSRSARPAVATALTLANTMHGLEVASDLDAAYNAVAVTVHPRTIGGSTVVLYSLPSTPALAPGEALTLWGDYCDPSNKARLVGGTSMATVAATTDYTANTQADGLGSDLTTWLTVTATAFAASVKFVVTNTHPSLTAYVTKLQQRGKTITDDGPLTCTAATTEAYGQRTLNVDMPYQASTVVAQGVADYLAQVYSSTAIRPASVTLHAATPMAPTLTAVLDVDVGDRLALTETVTALDAEPVTVQAIALDLKPGPDLTITYTVVPTIVEAVWILDDANGASDLDVGTVLGYL